VPTDVVGAQIFRKEGYLTAIVADTYHLFKPNMNFHQGCDIFHWIRGAEYDSCKAGPPEHLKLQDHITDRMPEHWHQNVLTALRNLDGRTEPEDFPCRQTMDQSLRVLEYARRDARELYLWIDTFQPHEPWCPPARFDTYGEADYSGPKVVMPPGGPADAWATEEVIQRTRSLYAGEAAYVDHCVGHLFDGMKQMGYFDSSVVVVLSDHGHPLADHGKFLKGPDRMYSELLKVPFIVRLPGGEHGGRRVTDLARFCDLMPTLLDLAGLGANATCMSGRSLRAILEGTGKSPYKAVFSGYFNGQDRCIRSERYSYVVRPAGQKDELYDLQADPRERNNLIDESPEAAGEMLDKVGTVYFGSGPKPRGVQGGFEVADTALG